jgi:hypothetical protein
MAQKNMTTMPEGCIVRLHYNYKGMMMEEFSNFTLLRLPDGKGNQLCFRHRGQEVTVNDVSDSLFDAARNIIEEERMYEYDSYYSLKMDGRILDGYSWDFDVYFEGGEKLLSGGRHVSPDGNGLQRISKLLNDAARESRG